MRTLRSGRRGAEGRLREFVPAAARGFGPLPEGREGRGETPRPARRGVLEAPRGLGTATGSGREPGKGGGAVDGEWLLERRRHVEVTGSGG